MEHQTRSRIPPPRAHRERVWPRMAFVPRFWEMSAASRWQVAAAAYGLNSRVLTAVGRPAIATLPGP